MPCLTTGLRHFSCLELCLPDVASLFTTSALKVEATNIGYTKKDLVRSVSSQKQTVKKYKMGRLFLSFILDFLFPTLERANKEVRIWLEERYNSNDAAAKLMLVAIS